MSSYEFYGRMGDWMNPQRRSSPVAPDTPIAVNPALSEPEIGTMAAYDADKKARDAFEADKKARDAWFRPKRPAAEEAQYAGPRKLGSAYEAINCHSCGSKERPASGSRDHGCPTVRCADCDEELDIVEAHCPDCGEVYEPWADHTCAAPSPRAANPAMQAIAAVSDRAHVQMAASVINRLISGDLERDSCKDHVKGHPEWSAAWLIKYQPTSAYAKEWYSLAKQTAGIDGLNEGRFHASRQRSSRVDIEMAGDVRPRQAPEADRSITRSSAMAESLTILGMTFIKLPNGVWMGTTPVTEEQYGELLSTPASGNLPKTKVSWHDAVAFALECNRRLVDSGCTKPLNGLIIRLPTSDEWEYACGGDPEPLSDYAWYTDNSDGHVHPVGQKRDNKYGLYDMLGNVWEWTSSSYGSCRVICGGCWINSAANCRSAFPLNIDLALRSTGFGFRLCLGKPC